MLRAIAANSKVLWLRIKLSYLYFSNILDNLAGGNFTLDIISGLACLHHAIFVLGI